MAKNIEINGERWIQTPIKMVAQFVDFFHYPLCVVLNDQKKVVIDYDPSDIKERLKKFESKKVVDVYLREEDLMAFMQDVKSHLEHVKIESGELTPKEIMSETCSISTCYEFMKNTFLQLGLSTSSLVLAEQINRRTMMVVRDTPNLVELLRRLRNEIHPHFVRALLSGSLSICLVESFSWGNDEIKEKVSMGALLSQLNWEQRHYDIFDHGKDLDELKHLPLEMAEKLREANIFSREVIEIVEQSFETPDGTGFPRGISAHGIGRLPAIYMVSADFIKQLIDCDFNYSKKEEIVQILHQRYNEGSFKQVMEGVSRKFAA